jgi:hypothetical protein
MKSTGEQPIGNDITGTSDAIVMASAPDIALPLETEPAANSGISQAPSDVSSGQMQLTPLAAIVAAAAAGLLLGVLLKKSLPSVKGRC